MQKSLTRLFTAVLMAALLISASIMSVSAATTDCGGHAESWTALSAAQTLSTDGNKYYLSDDVTLTGAITVAAKNVVLCLNGNDLTRDGNTAIVVNSGASLTLCNCSATASIVSGGNGSGTGDDRYVIANRGTLTMGADIVIETNCRGLLVGGGTATMNGSTIRPKEGSTTAIRGVYQSAGTFNMNDGTITGFNAGGNNGAGIMIEAGATFNMSNGTISNNRTTTNGGGVYTRGVMNMSGGTISGNSASNGGGVCVESFTYNTESLLAKLVMTGGVIEDNTATSKGGGVYVSWSNTTVPASLVMTSKDEGKTFGTIRNNKAPNATGGGVYLEYNTKASCTMDYGLITGNTCSGNGAGVMVQGADNGCVPVFTMNGGAIVGNTTSGLGDGIRAGGTVNVNGGYVGDELSGGGSVVIKGGYFNENTTKESNFASRWVQTATCDIKTVSVENQYGSYTKQVVLKELGDCPEHILWNEVKAATDIVGSGYYVLKNNITAAVTIPANADVRLCLSGYNISTGATTIKLNAGSKLTLCNCGTAGESNGVVSTTSTSDYAINGSYGECTLTLNDGVTVRSAANGIYLTYPRSTLEMQGGTINGAKRGVYLYAGTMNIHSGTIHGVPAWDNGNPRGGVYLNSTNAKLNMYGGTITGGEQGIALNNGTFTMTGGTITGCTTAGIYMHGNTNTVYLQGEDATITGCGIGVKTAASGTNKIEMKSGTISLNTAGGVNLDGSASFTMTGGTITENTTEYGGGVYMRASATFNMSGGTITKNTATNAGGGVYMCGSATFNMSEKAEISYNVASGDGAGVSALEGDGTFNMTGGTIKNNSHAEAFTAKNGGGGVLLFGTWTFNMSGGTICENTSKVNGGGVQIGSSAKFNMSGTAAIQNNTANGRGGGLYITGTGTISGKAKIAENTTLNGAGGGVCLGNANCTVTLSEQAEIFGNATQTHGGGIYVDLGTLNVNGGKVYGNSIVSGNGANLYVMGGVKDEVKQTAVINVTGGQVLLAKESGKAACIFAASKGTLNVSGNETIISGDVGANGVVNISGGAVDGKVYVNDPATAVITISGGKFSADTEWVALNDMLPKDNNLTMAEIEEGDYAYVVTENGFANTGAVMDHGSSLAFTLVLDTKADFNVENFELQIVTGGKEYSAELSDGSYGRMVITVNGIAAKEMHDNITYTVTDKESNIWFKKTMSLYDAAKMMHNDAESSDLEKRMLADMINYAIAAQEAFDYTTSDKVLGAGSENVTGEWDTTDATVTDGYGDKIAVSLNLKERIELNIYVNSANVDVAKSDAYDVTKVNDTVTRITFDKIDVKDVKTPITLALTVDGQEITITYSVEAYVAAAAGLGQQDLMIALQKYVDSVCEYTGN